MFSKLIVAYDGSKQSEKAYKLALDIASKFSAKMMVLSVAHPPEPPITVEFEAVLESATEYFEGHFKCLKELAESAGVDATFLVKVGHPAEQIVHLANEENADAIVMGHRGESLLQRWLLGSVAKRVISYAHCTVIVVR
ncbi:universal stress protein [Desulforhabdus amnigena]|jgi:nucleotide-binding universal stress UspA family protein|uniref:Universal stress protein n=1 Tax=Desulforhabdus amnigena TaxID=40218 RepID=A0A9W6FWL2_9BACT|nr:universal stress protein [Desulforhabdus amnigena]NLJ29476.1 universal stress protein [Deltaproteobacteria bacterium]GLI36158.1 universal stress protein [Desulforhabdus amnigena]